MKRISIIIALVLALPAMLFAATDGIFEYEETSSGDGVIITSCKPESYQSVVQIPSTIDGLPVVGIADGFLVDDHVEVVSLPATLMYVSGAAFTGATALEAVTVHPDNQIYASIRGVLYDKVALALVCYPQAIEEYSFEVPDGIKEIGDYAFAWALELLSVTLPDSIVRIGDYAFLFTDISSVDFLFRLETIGKGAFFGCTDLTEISLPASLRSIGDEAFAFTALSSFSIIGENPYFQTIDGVLFSKDGTTLVAYPASHQDYGTYTIPESVTRIGNSAFSYALLDQIVLPPSVEFIGEDAFLGSEIDEIKLPDSITYIGEGALDICSYLENIHVNEGSYAYEWIGASSLARYMDYSPAWIPSVLKYTDFETVLAVFGYPPAPTSFGVQLDVPNLVLEIGKFFNFFYYITSYGFDQLFSVAFESSGTDSGFFVDPSGKFAIGNDFNEVYINGMVSPDGTKYWAHSSDFEDQSIVALTVQKKDGTVFTIDAVFDFSLDACVSLCLNGVELVGDEPLSLDLFTGV